MPDYQQAALLMAIFQNMSAQETAAYAEEMMLSGEVVDLPVSPVPKLTSIPGVMTNFLFSVH